MTFRNFLCGLTFVFLISACSFSEWDKSNLHGNWQTVEWIQMGSGEAIDNMLTFEFDTTDRYSIDYGSEFEKGKYWISGNYLHTVEDGRAEKKVRIINLTSDSMVLEMNRSGFLEKLSLIKSQ